MHFAILIPDWNSLESVRRAHSDLEAAALVFFALLVLFDVLAHLFEDKNKDRARLFEKIGLCFFAIAVLAEIMAYPYGQRNDSLSEQLIGSLDAKARQASSDASKALTDSGIALGQAKDALNKTGAAEGAMKNAANEALNARTVASSALLIARGAHTEADSFEKDIVSAKRQAEDAESHLQAALQRTARLEQQLSWRTVTPEQAKKIKDFLAPLRFNPSSPFRGMKITFTYDNNDSEGAEYAKELADALRSALAGLGTAEIGEPKVSFTVWSTPMKGLLLQVKSDNAAALALQRALSSAGIDAPGRIDPKIDADIDLYVLGRPVARQ